MTKASDGVTWRQWLSNGENILSAIIGAFGLAILITSLRIGWGSLLEPGPGFFPGLIGLILVISSGLGCRYTLLFRKGSTEEPETTGGSYTRVAIVLGAYLIWILLMPVLGYIVITFITVLTIAKVMGYRSWTAAVVLALINTLFIYALFDVWFYVDLPRGLFGGGWF